MSDKPEKYSLLPHEIRDARLAQARHAGRAKNAIEQADEIETYPTLVTAAQAMGCSVDEIKRRQQAAKRFRNTSDEVQGLTARAANGIKANPDWLEEMPMLPEIRRVPNVGRVTSTEIALWLEKRNGISRDSGSENIFDRLSTGARNALWNDGIRTTDQLTRKTLAELKRTPNIGKASVRQIQKLLASLGLSLTR